MPEVDHHMNGFVLLPSEIHLKLHSFDWLKQEEEELSDW